MVFFSLFFCEISVASNRTITFPQACVKGDSIVIAAVGDILLHEPLQKKAALHGFTSLWQAAVPYLQAADISYANLEGPIAFGVTESGRKIDIANRFDYRVYTSYPCFNYHPSLAPALRHSGFTIVSTANNHILDRFSIGIDKTLAALDQAGVSHTGTRSKTAQQAWFQIISKKNIKIAWIACTEHTNDHPDVYHQVLYCYKKSDRLWIMNTIATLKSEVDAIIVSPHWGEEYQLLPTNEQTEFAHQVLEAGAIAVIGSHPHVLQPLTTYLTHDGRTTLIMYSLGNFVSYQGSQNMRTTVILLVGLTKSANGTIINGVRLVPMYMQNRDGLANIRLTRMPNDNNELLNHLFSHVIPMGNILFSLPTITNPECYRISK